MIRNLLQRVRHTSSVIAEPLTPRTMKKPKQFQLDPRMQLYNDQVKALRKQYAQELSMKPRKERAAEERAERRQKADAEWQSKLERLRASLSDPNLPTGIGSMHRTLRGAPALLRNRLHSRHRRLQVPIGLSPEEEESARAERDTAARQRHHQSQASAIAMRRSYLRLLAEDAGDWVTKENLEAKVQAALDTPTDWNETMADVMSREIGRKRRLVEAFERARESVCIDDATVNPVNMH